MIRSVVVCSKNFFGHHRKVVGHPVNNVVYPSRGIQDGNGIAFRGACILEVFEQLDHRSFAIRGVEVASDDCRPHTFCDPESQVRVIIDAPATKPVKFGLDQLLLQRLHIRTYLLLQHLRIDLSRPEIMRQPCTNGLN